MYTYISMFMNNKYIKIIIRKITHIQIFVLVDLFTDLLLEIL